MGATTEDMEFLAELQSDFLNEVSFQLEQCEESYLKLDDPSVRSEELGKIFRLAHSLKGTGAAVGFEDLAGFAHVVEDCLTLLRTQPALVSTEVISLLLRCGDAFKLRIEQLKKKDPSPWNPEALAAEVRAMNAKLAQGGVQGAGDHKPAYKDDDAAWKQLAQVTQLEVKKQELEFVKAESEPQPAVPTPPVLSGAVHSVVKVDAERVDAVLNLVGEMVVLKSQLLNRAEAYSSDQGLLQLVTLVDKAVRELQDKTLSMRLTPLKSLFLKTQRVVRDLSLKLEKPVEFEMTGEETEIDRSMVEALSDPLMHLARNALDHGIESSEVRASGGKPTQGTICLSAGYRGGRIVLELKDDGGGLHTQKIAAKAVEKGILSESAVSAMSDAQIHQLIFAAGFSTADKITDVSGRGVGLDVVRTQVEKLKGHIDLESTPGKGTTIRITVPLTTSILDGMGVTVGGETYLLPMESIIELAELESSSLVRVLGGEGTTVWHRRGKVYPVIDLRQKFGRSQSTGETRVALVDSGGSRIALLVDSLLGQTQVVLKPLEETVRSCKGISGAAILGDGRVALVLDPSGFAAALASEGAA
ncbi:MAG: chemotaxis protein CheA [Oligoflexia bacterium]